MRHRYARVSIGAEAPGVNALAATYLRIRRDAADLVAKAAEQNMVAAVEEMLKARSNFYNIDKFLTSTLLV